MHKFAPVVALATFVTACSGAYTTEAGDEPEAAPTSGSPGAPAAPAGTGADPSGPRAPAGDGGGAGAPDAAAGSGAPVEDARLDGVLTCQQGNGVPGALGLGGACPGVTETEPNDSPAVAATTADRHCGSVSGADVDVIKVKLSAGQWLGYAVQASSPVEVSVTGAATGVAASHVVGATCSSAAQTVLLTIRARGGAAASYTIRLQRT